MTACVLAREREKERKKDMKSEIGKSKKTKQDDCSSCKTLREKEYVLALRYLCESVGELEGLWGRQKERS